MALTRISHTSVREMRPVVKLAAALEDAGVAAISLHARSCLQQFSGAARWDDIRRVVGKLRRIPVIGNGDIAAPALARAMLNDTGCAGVMVGRAALDDPWIIGEIHAALAGRPIIKPSRGERMDFMLRHCDAMAEQHGEPLAARLFRRWLPHYARGLQLGREAMIALLRISAAGELRQRCRELRAAP